MDFVGGRIGDGANVPGAGLLKIVEGNGISGCIGMRLGNGIRTGMGAGIGSSVGIGASDGPGEGTGVGTTGVSSGVGGAEEEVGEGEIAGVGKGPMEVEGVIPGDDEGGGLVFTGRLKEIKFA